MRLVWLRVERVLDCQEPRELTSDKPDFCNVAAGHAVLSLKILELPPGRGTVVLSDQKEPVGAAFRAVSVKVRSVTGEFSGCDRVPSRESPDIS